MILVGELVLYDGSEVTVEGRTVDGKKLKVGGQGMFGTSSKWVNASKCTPVMVDLEDRGDLTLGALFSKAERLGKWVMLRKWTDCYEAEIMLEDSEVRAKKVATAEEALQTVIKKAEAVL